ncbi:hypothetical protein Ahy_B03g067561 isoform B [Arachis hypogaea]|uniref:Uncharacterized protein n=1 Tax=Arachis hypogaea TaxID=3818 RepID=A0A445A741_ARAHY|nr:hypothetical protein Ahy_B03g067561 isoform B [Arachis hypogaea]
MKLAWAGSMLGSTLTSNLASITVYSDHVAQLEGWYSLWPLQDILEVLSGIKPVSLTGHVMHKFDFPEMQFSHSWHSSMYVGITVSPSFTFLTSSPTVSTTLQLMVFIMHG